MRKRGVKNWMSRDEGRSDQLGRCRQRRTKHTGKKKQKKKAKHISRSKGRRFVYQAVKFYPAIVEVSEVCPIRSSLSSCFKTCGDESLFFSGGV